MKRTVKVVCVFLVCVVCVCALGGCQKAYPNTITGDDIVKALQDAGYTEAWFNPDNYNLYLSNDENSEYFWLVEPDEGLCPDDGKNYICTYEIYKLYRGKWSCTLRKTTKGVDYTKALDAVLPFFDPEYNGEIKELLDKVLQYEKDGSFDDYFVIEEDNYHTEEASYKRENYEVICQIGMDPTLGRKISICFWNDNY